MSEMYGRNAERNARNAEETEETQETRTEAVRSDKHQINLPPPDPVRISSRMVRSHWHLLQLSELALGYERLTLEVRR